MEEEKLHNPTVRVLDILETAYSHEKGISFTDLSRQTGISKGTLHPIVATLVAKGYLQCQHSLFTLHKVTISITKPFVRISSAY